MSDEGFDWRIRWFGDPWPSAEFRSPICDDDTYRIDTPIGEACAFCTETIESGDRGERFASGEFVHAECALRNVVGNHIHIAGKCTYIGQCNQLSDLSYREEAIAVWNRAYGHLHSAD